MGKTHEHERSVHSMKVGYMTNAFGPLVGHGNGVISVSYTHLDVYKRQEIVRFDAFFGLQKLQCVKKLVIHFLFSSKIKFYILPHKPEL